MSLSVVIPSRTMSNLLPCVAAIRKHEPAVRIIVIDDGVDKTHAGLSGCELVDGIKPFVFSRNINLGIAAAGTDDVVLANDDTLLETPSGFSAMQKVSVEHPEYGILSAVTLSIGNRNQLPHRTGLRDEPRMLCFVCVLIPRTTIERVGLLDERFTGYSHQDDDYCLRVRNAGLKLGIYDFCRVDHETLVSTYRGNGKVAELATGAAIFKNKWGSSLTPC